MVQSLSGGSPIPESKRIGSASGSRISGSGLIKRRSFSIAAAGAALGSRFLQAETPLAAAGAPSTLAGGDFDKPREIRLVPPASGSKNLRVASWNIGRGERLGIIASELKRDPAGLLLLQEVDWHAARSGNLDEAAELGTQLQMNVSYAIEFEELSQERDQQAFIGQATLTRLPIRRSRVLRFRNQSGFWKPRGWLPSSLPLMQRRLGSRVALVTDLDFGGRLLVVYNAHLESRSYGRIQAHQMDEMLMDLRQYPPDTNVILGGDLNTKYFPSVFVRKLQRAGFRSVIGERIERTHAIAMALDWIFVKGAIQISEGAVRREVKGSDHYPVYAQLQAK